MPITAPSKASVIIAPGGRAVEYTVPAIGSAEKFSTVICCWPCAVWLTITSMAGCETSGTSSRAPDAMPCSLRTARITTELPDEGVRVGQLIGQGAVEAARPRHARRRDLGRRD